MGRQKSASSHTTVAEAPQLSKARVKAGKRETVGQIIGQLWRKHRYLWRGSKAWVKGVFWGDMDN